MSSSYVRYTQLFAFPGPKSGYYNNLSNQRKAMSAASARKVAASNHFSNLEFIMSLNKYIPSLVLQQLILREQSADKQEKLPELQPMETVVVFADISGFTNLSEACAKKGTRGNEELAFCINRYMEGMVTNLNQYGGDIIKFVGDAMIVMWPPIDRQAPGWQDTRVDTIRRATQCAQDIQKHMNNMQILPGATLSVKIGIGYGTCALLYVGGVFSRSESFTIGEALMLALRSEGQATAGGQIIVAEPAFQHVREYFKAKELIDEESVDRDKFYLVDYKSAGPRVKIQADAMKLRSQFSSELLARIQQKMQGCVASAIIPYLQIDQERYGSENRSLTVAFVSLGVELSSASSKAGMDKIQSIVTEVQKQVYRMQGSLNKLVMDDKGSTLICVWGMLPFAHDDDASRAILAGFNMIKALNKIDGTYCNIGISSGECFSGVVGTSGSRKEFSVLGDVVNLAARIMGTIKGNKLKNEVRCDMNTRMLAGNFFDFKYDSHNELKGKSISIPFFQPINPEIKFEQARNKVLSPDYFLSVHPNPLNLERTSDIHQKVRTIGFSETMGGLVSDITDYYTDEEGRQEWPLLAVVKGEVGSGKTAFMRNLIDELHQASDFAPYLRANKQKLPIFASTVNAETQLQFLNVWRPIFQMMLIFFCKRAHTKKEPFLAEVIANSNNFDKVDLVCEIVGVDKQLMLGKRGVGSHFAEQCNVPQAKPKSSAFPFITMERYQKQEENELIEFLTQLMKCLIGEENDISGWHSMLDQRNQNQRSRHDMTEDQEDKPPYVIVIDNAHNMCPVSWSLLDNLLDECYRLVIVIVAQTDDMDRLKIHPMATASFEQVWESIVDRIPIIEKELPRLSADDIGGIIRANASKYLHTFSSEMKEMTRIIDPNKTIKTEQMGVEWRERLTQKWQLAQQINNVDADVLQIVVTKCRGNALLCLQYFINMLHNGFVEVSSNGSAEPTEKFYFCAQINDWTNVPVPRLALKINTALLDQYYYSVQMKARTSNRPGELQNCTTSIVLLKAAAVLGEEFELQALKQISPFVKNTTHSKRVEEAVRQLEQNDFIEIVDETDQRNAVCRFNKCLLRESTYQILLYKSCKKDLHTATEKYIQSKPNLTSMKDNSLVTEQLKQHMLLAQDTEEEKDLLVERRTALVVLRVQNLINRHPREIILKDRLNKQGDSVNKKVSKRLVTLTQFALKWYHDNDEEFYADKYMGAVELPFIYAVVKSKQSGNEKPAFSISVTMYIDKRGEEMSKRDIFFSCETEECRDKWIIAIDYLKTRAIYDAYAKKNTLVNFVGAAKEEESRDANGEEHMNDRDHSNLLYDFGDQLKGNTMGGSANMGTRGSILQLGTGGKDSFMAQRKQSIFRSPGTDKSPLTAHEILPKLKLLYKVSMVSFMHHLDQGNFKTKSIVARTASSAKPGSDFIAMQIPPLDKMTTWNCQAEIEESLHADDLKVAAMAGQSVRSAGRDSLFSAYNTANNQLQAQNSVSSQQEGASRHRRKLSQSRASSEKLNEKGTPGGPVTRRSSSISADHVMALGTQPKAHDKSKISEEDEETSNGSGNGLSKLTSSQNEASNLSNAAANVQPRFSQEVMQATLGVVNSETKQQKKQLSQKYRNSEESSKNPNTPPMLTQPAGTDARAVHRLSSHGYSDPQGADNASKDEDTSGFSPLIGTIDRENRQTFASHAGAESPRGEANTSSRQDLRHNKEMPRITRIDQTNCSSILDQSRQSAQQSDSRREQPNAAAPRATSSRASNQVVDTSQDSRPRPHHRSQQSQGVPASHQSRHNVNSSSASASHQVPPSIVATPSLGGAHRAPPGELQQVGQSEQLHFAIQTGQVQKRLSANPLLRSSSNNTSQQQPTFQASSSNNVHSRGGTHSGGGAGESIGKETDKRELSIIQHKYDSRNYAEMVSNSILDPLLAQASSQQDAAGGPLMMVNKSGTGVGDNSHIRSSSLSQSQASQQHDQNSSKLMSQLGSLIKQQLNSGLSDLFATQQQKIDQMAENQKVMHEQMARQQTQLLNSSFHAGAASTQHQMSQPNSFYLNGSAAPQTPTTQATQQLYSQLPQVAMGRPPMVLQSPQKPQYQYAAHQQHAAPNLSELLTPVRHSTQGAGSRPYPGSFVHAAPHVVTTQSPLLHPSQTYGYGGGILNTSQRLATEHSVGGMTSKRSHKHLLDSAAHPIQSKQESESLHDQPDDEPTDPMLEEPDFADLSSMNRLKMTNKPDVPIQAQAQQQPLRRPGGPPSYELDLQQKQNWQSVLRPEDAAAQSQRQQVLPGKPRSFHHYHDSSKETVNLLAQLSEDNHTEYEAMVLGNANQRQPQQPMRRVHRLPSNNNEADDTVSAKTLKPSMADQQYGVGPTSYATQTLYNNSHGNRAFDQPNSQSTAQHITQQSVHSHQPASEIMSHHTLYGSHQAQMQGHHLQTQTMPQNQPMPQFYHQVPPPQAMPQAHQQYPSTIDFADNRLVFPPPEKWTETQYAMYEEPLVLNEASHLGHTDNLASAENPLSDQIVVAVRESRELKMGLQTIPKGAGVRLVQLVHEAQVCHVEYAGQVGLYKLQDFVKPSSKSTKPQELSDHKSPLRIDTQTSKKRTKKEASKQQAQYPNKQGPLLSVYQTEKGRAGVGSSVHHLNEGEDQDGMPTVSIDVSLNQHDRSASYGGMSAGQTLPLTGGPGQNLGKKYRPTGGIQYAGNGAVQDSTIEQMSPINAYAADNSKTTSGNITQPNFFREEPEKQLSKHLRTLTSKELAHTSKRLLEEDKATHKQKNLKMVERQKRKAQAARKQAAAQAQ